MAAIKDADQFQEMRTPYFVGNVIDMVFEGHIVKVTILAKIERYPRHWKVEVSGDNIGKRICTLDSYDCRYLEDHREDWFMKPWSSKFEEQYLAFVESGEAQECVTEWKREEPTGAISPRKTKDFEDYELWADEKEEAWLRFCEIRDFERTQKAYRLLRPLQGKRIPKLIGTVWPLRRGASPTDPFDELLDTPGLLLQYIDGFQLREFEGNLPQSQWAAATRSAVNTLNLCIALGVCSFNLTLQDLIVEKKSGKVFAVSFRRGTFEDETGPLNFDYSVTSLDHEGAVGRRMQFLTKGLEGGYMHEWSRLYEGRRDRWMRDESLSLIKALPVVPGSATGCRTLIRADAFHFSRL